MVDMKASFNIPTGTTKDELIAAMEAIPGDAIVRVKSYAGDRPWESGTETISFNWTR